MLRHICHACICLCIHKCTLDFRIASRRTFYVAIFVLFAGPSSVSVWSTAKITIRVQGRASTADWHACNAHTLVSDVMWLIGCRTSHSSREVSLPSTGQVLTSWLRVLSSCRQRHTHDQHIRSDERQRSVTNWFHSLRDWNSALGHRSQVWARLPVVFSYSLQANSYYVLAHKHKGDLEHPDSSPAVYPL